MTTSRSEENRKWRQRLTSIGVCYECRKRAIAPRSVSRCESCLEKHRRRFAKSRQRIPRLARARELIAAAVEYFREQSPFLAGECASSCRGQKGDGCVICAMEDWLRDPD